MTESKKTEKTVEDPPRAWKIFYSKTDKFDNEKITITAEGPDKAGVEELFKTVKKEMVK